MTDTQTDMSPAEARAALQWLMAMGADEIITESPVDRFSALTAAPAPAKSKPHAAPAPAVVKAALATTPVSVESRKAADCTSIVELEAGLLAMEDCPLKRTASNLCFACGNFNGHTMVIGDVAGREEDLEGAPFAGQSAALLERMLAAIGLSSSAGENAAQAVSLFNLIPWRPPGQRPPTESEVAQCLPYLSRAIEIIQPRFILCFGNLPAQALLGRTESLMTLRGKWLELTIKGRSIPVMTSFAPRLLLQQRAQKRLAWRDLLSLQEKMKANG